MEINLNAPHIWLASEAVDFRKSINGLSALVIDHLQGELRDSVYIFYNRGKDKVKIIGYHRHGFVLIYKRLSKKKFTFKASDTDCYQIDAKQLSWLLAGLDWVSLSACNELISEDFY